MKIKLITHVCTLTSAAAVLLSGCAQSPTATNTSLLSSAGFQTKKPVTVEQRELFGLAPNYRLIHVGTARDSLYAYKDYDANVAYIGGEAEYQRYRQLAAEQGFRRGTYIPQDLLEPDPSARWLEAYGFRE